MSLLSRNTNNAQPDLVINAGTAGGFKAKGAAIGDVFVSSRTLNHDRRIPLPGFQEFGIGCHDAYPTVKLRAALGYKHGAVTTSNSLDFTTVRANIMHTDVSSK
jgi:5'-methylthioadenosine nucleosidase